MKVILTFTFVFFIYGCTSTPSSVTECKQIKQFISENHVIALLSENSCLGKLN